MPLSFQGYHAVMDGYHMGRYYDVIKELFQQPQVVLGEG
jgi:chloramphenicol O-acetyltransferase